MGRISSSKYLCCRLTTLLTFERATTPTRTQISMYTTKRSAHQPAIERLHVHRLPPTYRLARSYPARQHSAQQRARITRRTVTKPSYNLILHIQYRFLTFNSDQYPHWPSIDIINTRPCDLNLLFSFYHLIATYHIHLIFFASTHAILPRARSVSCLLHSTGRKNAGQPYPLFV